MQSDVDREMNEPGEQVDYLLAITAPVVTTSDTPVMGQRWVIVPVPGVITGAWRAVAWFSS